MRTQSSSAELRELERNEEEIARGSRANGALRSIKPFIDEMRSDIATHLARGAEQMSNETMRILVGKLAGLQALLNKLDAAAQSGSIASEKRDGR